MGSTGRDRYAIELTRKSSWELQPPAAAAGMQGYSVIGFIKAHGQSTLFLIALGAIIGLLETGIDSGIAGFGEAIKIILERTSKDVYIVQLVVFVAFVLLLTAAAATLTKLVDPKAAGSGIPEMKYILSSDVHKEPRRLLHFSTLVVKVFGLIMMVGSGLPIGREGPFVHMAGIVANLLLRLPFFHESNLSGGVKRQLFAAACAGKQATS
jgi:H+/Cl- antiporter ClcA